MRIKTPIDLNELLRLKEDGWSSERLARRFEVSKATIKRRLREAKPRDPAVLDFARMLADLAIDAPEGFCRKELLRLVNDIRRHGIVPDTNKKKEIIHSIETGAREIEEIMDDCQISKDEAVRLIKLLISEKIVFARRRGGRLNAGLKPKFHFFLTSDAPQLTPSQNKSGAVI